MASKKYSDTRDEIVDHLRVIRRPLTWIAHPNTDIPYGSVYSIFEQKVMELSEERLKKINKWLGTEFILKTNATKERA